MAVRIQNLTNRLVLLRGNSGESFHFSPLASLEVSEVEITDNEFAMTLMNRGIIAIHHKTEKVESRFTEHNQKKKHKLKKK